MICHLLPKTNRFAVCSRIQRIFNKLFGIIPARNGQILPLYVDVVADVEFSAEDSVSNSSGDADRLAIVRRHNSNSFATYWNCLVSARGLFVPCCSCCGVFFCQNPPISGFVVPLAMFDIA